MENISLIAGRVDVGKRISSRQRLLALAYAHPLLTVFSIALFARVAVAVFVTGIFSGRYVFDDSTYHLMAADMAADDTGHWDQFTHTLYWATATLTLPVTALYRVFGPSTLAAQLFVALLGAGAAALTARLAMEWLSPKIALVAGLVVAVLPSQVFWSAMLMKDAAVWFVLTGLALTVAVALRSTGRKLLLMAAIAALLLFLLAFLRLHTLVVAAWALALASLVGMQKQRLQRIGGAVAIALLVPWFAGGIGPAGLSFVANAGSLEDRRFNNAVGAETAVVDTSPDESDRHDPVTAQKLSLLETRATGLEEKAQRLEGRAGRIQLVAPGASTRDKARAPTLRARAERLHARASDFRAEAARLSSPSPPPAPRLQDDDGLLDPNLTYLPRGLSVMLFEPVPVPFDGSLTLRLARLESLLWYPLLAVAVVGLFRAFRKLRVTLYPLLAGGAIMVVYGLTEGNIGTAHRHRGEFVWVVALLVAIGIAHLLSRRSERSFSFRER